MVSHAAQPDERRKFYTEEESMNRRSLFPALCAIGFFFNNLQPVMSAPTGLDADGD